MSYASLMVHVDIDGNSADRIHLAAGLAERFGARLIGVAAAAPYPPVVSDGVIVDGALIEAERKEIEAELARSEARFMSIAGAGAGAHAVEWRSAVDLPTDVLSEASRAADLLIIGREAKYTEKSLHRAIDPADILMRAGRPVLLVPQGARTLDGRRVIVAWKNTREARRAVRDALPLLVRAERVTVIGIGNEPTDAARADIEDVAAYLRTHKVTVRTDLRSLIGKTVAEGLIEAAEQDDADLIVAGAYGHSRFREWAFGGVTRDLLARSPACCLMAH